MLSDSQIEKNKQEYLRLLGTVKREGIDKLIVKRCPLVLYVDLLLFLIVLCHNQVYFSKLFITISATAGVTSS